VRIEGELKIAILTVLRYIKTTTGEEPTQEELAECLQGYFILNEISNQIKYLRKKPTAEPVEAPADSIQLSYKLNLLNGPAKNSLARWGIFRGCISEAIQAMQQFVKNITGAEPSMAEIARSLSSSFILSEITNHIKHARSSVKPTVKNHADSR
jgi:hypothetical protein